MMFRNLMSMDVEACIRAYRLDAVVLLSGCDEGCDFDFLRDRAPVRHEGYGRPLACLRAGYGDCSRSAGGAGRRDAGAASLAGGRRGRAGNDARAEAGIACTIVTALGSRPAPWTGTEPSLVGRAISTRPVSTASATTTTSDVRSAPRATGGRRTPRCCRTA